MRTRSLARAAAGAVALLLLVACTGSDDPAAEPDRAACDALAADLADQMQAYVDSFDAPADEGTAPPPLDLVEVSEQARADGDELGCDRSRLSAQLAERVTGLTGRSPVARAVAETLRDDVLTPGDVDPRTLELQPDGDVAAAVRDLPPGSTLVLGAGRYDLEEMLVVLREVTVVGAGERATTIVSEAAGAALLSLSAELVLRDLTVRHEGDEPASVLVVGAGATSVERGHLTGGTTAADGADGAGLTVLPQAPEGTAVRFADSRSSRNEGVGISAAGAGELEMVDAVVERNGTCGICLSGAAQGTAERTRVVGNDVGLGASGEASIAVSRAEVSGNRSAGVVVAAAGSATVEQTVVRNNGDVGISLESSARSSVVDGVVEDHRTAGIVVLAGTPELRGNGLAGNGVGVQADGEGAPRVVGNKVAGSRLAAIVFRGSSAGSARDNTCDAGAPGIVLDGRTRAEIGANACRVVDQR